MLGGHRHSAGAEGGKMHNKRALFIILLIFIIQALPAQEIKSIFEHRFTIGNFNSYWNDDIGILEAGYDFVIPLLKINPEYNIFYLGIGPSCLFAFDSTQDPREPTVGFSLNANSRIYTPDIKNNSFFLEEVISFVVYTNEYPSNGTMINGGWHLGGGWEYKTSNNSKIFSSIMWFHTSNNDIYGRDRNPSVNSIGFSTGIQL